MTISVNYTADSAFWLSQCFHSYEPPEDTLGEKMDHKKESFILSSLKSDRESPCRTENHKVIIQHHVAFSWESTEGSIDCDHD
jgi:hypothetical protein